MAPIPPQTPIPEHIGAPDVANIEHLTRILRAVDYQHGGGACREAILAQTAYARAMLQSDCSDEVRKDLELAVADLHNLAAWASFDIGHHSSARKHFASALVLAKSNENSSLAANVLYRLGRLHLHRGHFQQALRFFQLGQLAAGDADDFVTVAMLHANIAWAYALMGYGGKAVTALERAQDEFGRGEGNLPAWVAFFGAADLSALTGMVHSLLPADEKEDHVTTAINCLTASINARGSTNTRSTIFELTALATARLKAFDTRAGVEDGNRAVDLALQVRSVRTVDRLAPLLEAAQAHPKDAEAVALARRIVTLQGA
ncbi:tol-pal system YbgF family protein [Actinoplanes sp. NPDC020271]|uniref:tol-pal system YbgF family protein n=1 Tax=Actinoplanes sp. NPDC020271 TaxID=3363896 RepID=UPI0037AB86AE